MRKNTILCILLVLPFLSIGQLKDYTFSTDNNKEGWSGAGFDLSTTPNPTGGFLIADGKGFDTGFPQIRGGVYTPLLAVASNQIIVVTIEAENATDATVWQVANLDEGSTSFGNSVFGEFTMPIVTPGTGTSTFEVEVPINSDNTNNGIERIAIRAKVGKDPGVSGTIKIDRISLSLKTIVTENSFVSNHDFELGDLTGWSEQGGETVASITTGNGGGSAGQLSFSTVQTKAQYLNNTQYDFGTTVTPDNLAITFDAIVSLSQMSIDAGTNVSDIQIQAVYDLYDDAGNKIGNSLNTGISAVASNNSWKSITLNKTVTVPFNKIRVRLKIKEGAGFGDKVAFDNVDASFSYITLGVDELTENKNTFKLYPNPAKDVLNIKSLNTSVTSASIYSITGKRVLQSDKLHDGKVNITHLKNGVYLVKIEDSDHNFSVKKLVINK